MKVDTLRKNMWNDAGKAAIFFGLISTAYLFITQFLGQMQLPSFITALLNFVLWAAKFGGCIWLMKYCMTKFAKENSQADNSDTFRFGMLISLLSALIYSAASFANAAYISADLYTEQIDAVMQIYSRHMDSNSISAMEKFMDILPQLTFFSNLIYCFIFGTILSAILSRSIPSKDPFSGITA